MTVDGCVPVSDLPEAASGVEAVDVSYHKSGDKSASVYGAVATSSAKYDDKLPIAAGTSKCIGILADCMPYTSSGGTEVTYADRYNGAFV